MLPKLPIELLDIGGEGRHACAWNLNPSRVKTLGPDKGQAIPRLILGRADAIPLPERSVRTIISERTPLTRAALLEIARILLVDGTLVLRHLPLPDYDPHALARQLLLGNSVQRMIVAGSRRLQETTFMAIGDAGAPGQLDKRPMNR